MEVKSYISALNSDPRRLGTSIQCNRLNCAKQNVKCHLNMSSLTFLSCSSSGSRTMDTHSETSKSREIKVNPNEHQKNKLHASRNK